ncbi:MAG: FAD-dependent oxidoreductase, partial [bacterium]
LMDIIEVDVVVIGGGTSGIFAALYLALKGFKVALIERAGKIGGALVNSLVYPTAGFHTPNGKLITSPLVNSFLEEAIKNKLTLGHIRDPLNFAFSVTPIHPTAYKLLFHKLLNLKNFIFLPFSKIENISYKNQKVNHIHLKSVFKKYKVKSKLFVDSSGTLITSYFLPMDYTFDIYNLQALSLIFKVSNIDFQSILNDVKKNPQEFYSKTNPDLMISQNFLSISGYYQIAKQFLNNKDLLLTRDRFLFFSDIDKNSVVVNTTRLFLKELDKELNINDIESIENQSYKFLLKQVFYIHKVMKDNIEGFRNSYISEIADFVGIRQFRNIKGLYTLELNDIKLGKFLEDTISIGTWPIDIHISNSIIENKISENGYGIPFRSCINNYKNIVFIGKNISADKYAFSSLRIQATLMIMGENIGRILETCLTKKINPVDLDYKLIQKSVKFNY